MVGLRSGGRLHHDDLLVVDHPAAWDDVADVVVTVPTAEDPRWYSTTSVDSVLVVSADALHLDPRLWTSSAPAMSSTSIPLEFGIGSHPSET
jgi:hypothetical protein